MRRAFWHSFRDLFQASILGCILVTLWLTLDSLWPPLGHFWLPFGSLLAPFGSLLAPFWLQWAHFWHLGVPFFSLLTSPGVILVHFRAISSKKLIIFSLLTFPGFILAHFRTISSNMSTFCFVLQISCKLDCWTPTWGPFIQCWKTLFFA